MLSAAISTASCAGIMVWKNIAQAAQEETVTPAPSVIMSKESGCYPEAFSLGISVKGLKRFITQQMGAIQLQAVPEKSIQVLFL